MISSDAQRPAGWSSDPLLSTAGHAPAFLRMPWDDAQASNFGPWRVVPNNAPLVATSLESASDPEMDLLPDTGEPTDGSDEALAQPHAALPPPGPSQDEIEAIRAAAYAEGFAAGQAQGKLQAEETLAQEQAQDRALITQVVSALQALGADKERLFAPLYRLSIHLAEQLVRGELGLSGAAIEQLVKHCLSQFDQPTDKAIVHLNPQDLERLSRYADAARGLRLEPDARLLSGSVRVQVNDTVVEDLIEHRLEVLARQLLGDAHTLVNSANLDVVAADEDNGDEDHEVQP